MKLDFLKRRPSLQPTGVDLAYRRTTNRIGATLLLFLILFDTLGLVFLPAVSLGEELLPTDAAYALEDVLDSITYLLSFMLPAILFYLITPKRDRLPMQLSPRMPRGTLWLILMGMTVISTAAIVNSWMVSLFDYGTFSSEVLWETSTMQDFEGVLLFLSTAIVPAFCEEFLFRGIICNHLRPYGKTVAVVGSSLLFGLMHQNVGQMFYATVAGVVLSVIYLESRSIWAPTLLHMFNNLTSVVYDIVADRLSRTSANRVLALLDAFVIGLGLIALLCWMIRGDRARAKCEEGSILNGQWREEASLGVPTAAFRVRYFFSPMMLAFVGLALWQMIVLLSYAIRYIYG